MKFSILLSMAAMNPQFAAASSSIWVEARAETDAIPAGKTHTDDSAIWVNPIEAGKSRILGTSKYNKEGLGGLGLYDFQGRELQFIKGSKLNSVDVLGSLAVASNRSEKALDLFTVSESSLTQVARRFLKDKAGQALEPYGLCLGQVDEQHALVFLPFKDGHLYSYRLELNAPYRLEAIADYDLTMQVGPDLDARIQDVVYKAAQAEDELDELEEALAERYILEGCVYDRKRSKVYVGMENAGVWAVPVGKANTQPQLIAPISGSWTDIENWSSSHLPRLTDDIEGLDLFSIEGRDYLLISVQGLSEFALYDLETHSWKGNVKIRLGDDQVSKTDGLALSIGNFGTGFEEGILVVHDDQNTKGSKVQEANYKIISFSDLWQGFSQVKQLQ